MKKLTRMKNEGRSFQLTVNVRKKRREKNLHTKNIILYKDFDKTLICCGMCRINLIFPVTLYKIPTSILYIRLSSILTNRQMS